MILSTRRRALGLLLAAAAVLRFRDLPRASAATKAATKKDCYESKPFGAWTAQATDSLAGARINEVPFTGDGCDLRIEIQVAASFEGKIVVYGDPDKTRLPKKFLIDPENRLVAWTEDGKEVVNEPLCGNCTDIFDDKVSVVLPLACAPLFRDSKTIDMGVELPGKEQCRFSLDGETLRAALDWAAERQTELAEAYEEDQCKPPPGGCFITTACCDVLGLDDECFELRALRRYRDDVLARQPGGTGKIAIYYAAAPLILARLPRATHRSLLRALYARFILPAALAATLGLNTLAYRLYARMIRELISAFVPEKVDEWGETRISD